MPFCIAKYIPTDENLACLVKINDACSSSRSVASNQERMVPFFSIYKEGVLSGAH